MDSIFTEIDPWMTAAALAVSMLLGWGLGWWRGRRRPQGQREAPAGKFHDSILALLGLLLAFTFSMSLAKHDQRRQMVVTDSNAIGDFYTSASLVKEPLRGKLQGVIREYVELRLAMVKDRFTEADLQKAQELQNRMQDLVGVAVDGGTPVVVPLVNTLNEVTSSHAARLAATRDRLPPSIGLLLFVTAVVTMVLIGKQQGASREWHLSAMAGFVVLVSMVVGIILDLNQPQRGLIQVSQEPMQRLLSGMTR
jgi:hypothetical protein